MHIFHKWSRWGDPEPFVIPNTDCKGADGETYVTGAYKQKRTCTKCGKIQYYIVRKITS